MVKNRKSEVCASPSVPPAYLAKLIEIALRNDFSPEARLRIFDKLEIRLLESYLVAVDETKKYKRISKEQRKALLPKLLGPLLAFCDSPFGQDLTFEFISEIIRVDKEVFNFENLTCDEKRYDINYSFTTLNLPNGDKSRACWIYPSYKTICLKEDAEKYFQTIEKRKRMGLSTSTLGSFGYISLIDYYERWLPDLDKEKIKSKDLLDQILVCFTIKRALNGDKAAINRLYSLYESTAVGTAYKMARSRGLLERWEMTAKTRMPEKKPELEIRQEAKIILRQLISGLNPKEIINCLLSGKRVGVGIEKFFLFYFSEYVPEELDKLFRGYNSKDLVLPGDKSHPPNDRARCLHASLKDVRIRALLDLYGPILHNTRFKSRSGNVRQTKFNSYSFRPNKKTNLTTWLFGTRKNRMQGKFPQMLKETVLDGLAKFKNESLYSFSEVYGDEKNGEKDQMELVMEGEVNQGIAAKDAQGDQGIRTIFDRNLINKVKDLLITNHISERDGDIYLKIIFGEAKKAHLAKEYNLSRTGIYYIYNKVKSLPALKSFAKQIK